jgi:hypothetical protein
MGSIYSLKHNKMDFNNLTPKGVEKLKKDILKLTRTQLVDKIWDLASDEIGTPEDVLIIAKESENQLRTRLLYIVSWYEHLNK